MTDACDMKTTTITTAVNELNIGSTVSLPETTLLEVTPTTNTGTTTNTTKKTSKKQKDQRNIPLAVVAQPVLFLGGDGDRRHLLSLTQ